MFSTLRSSSRSPIASASRLLSSHPSTSSRSLSSSCSRSQQLQESGSEGEGQAFQASSRGPRYIGRPDPEVRAKTPAWQLAREDGILKDDLYRALAPLGSYQTSTEWTPLSPSSQPPSAFEVSISHLVAAGTHMGHNPKLTQSAYHPYLAGRRAGMDIINVEHTLPSLRKACGMVRDLVRDDGVIVFIGKKKAVKVPLMKAVDRLGGNGHAVTSRWIPGTLTNAHVMYGPDVVLSGAHIPDLIICLDPLNQTHIIREANNLKIPTMAICDTDVDPRIVTFPILSNLDSTRSTELILGALGRAGEEGLLARQGRPAGSKFLLLPGSFQAKITNSRDPEVLAQNQGEDEKTWTLHANNVEGLERERKSGPPGAGGAR